MGGGWGMGEGWGMGVWTQLREACYAGYDHHSRVPV